MEPSVYKFHIVLLLKKLFFSFQLASNFGVKLSYDEDNIMLWRVVENSL